MTTSTDSPASSTVDASATWYAGYAGQYAWQFPPKPPEPRPKPKSGRTRCFICGRFAPRASEWSTHRACGRCDTVWQGHDNVKFTDTVTDDIWRAECAVSSGVARHFFMGEGIRSNDFEPDAFDEFIDHSRAHIPSPA